jgi:putative transposase
MLDALIQVQYARCVSQLLETSQRGMSIEDSMILTHRIALNPTDKQEEYFRRAAGIARFVWNWALATWKQQYEVGEKPHAGSLKKLWNHIKGEQYPWVYEVHKDVNQQPFAYLQSAFTRFFRGEAGFPQFKKKGVHDSFYVSNDKMRVHGKRVYISRLGWVRMREALRFTGRVLSATVSRSADRWFVSIQVEVGEYYKPRTADGIVGVDLGVHTLATLSTGETIKSPRPLQKLLAKLKRRQRWVSRKQKGSQNRRKAVQRLARLHRRIKDVRHDALHKVTTKLCRENQAVAIEDLNVQGMLTNHTLARAISDMGFHEFRRQLTYKAAITGTHVAVIDRWFPSSKTCSACGVLLEGLRLSDRIIRCTCGVVIERDYNAALNIRRVGFTRTDACEHGRAVVEAGTKPCSLVSTF